MLQLFEYELPFRSPFKTGSATFKTRKGILIHYEKNDVDLVAEAAPLPGFSEESYEDVKHVLVNQKKFIQDFLESDLTLDHIRDLAENPDLKYPSIQFPLSYLSLSLLAEKKGKTIYDLFRTIPANAIQVNDVIGYSSIEKMEENLEQSVLNGFKCIKIKAKHPVDKLASLLSRIQKKYPSVHFRLDANQSWPVSSIEKNCGLLRNLHIEYIEEPTHVEDLQNLKQLQKNCSVPLALDESVSSIKNLKFVLKNHPEIFVIIKPMLLGNILKIYETILEFRGSCKYIVCTTALESSIGRSMVATTTSLLGDQNLSHGLNTGHLFANDLLPDLEIKNGSLKHHQYKHRTKSFKSIKTTHLKKLG
ncbi:enolase C-terminal domain-like protein [Rhodohalobacter sp. 614A]|uniref:enolase C-terminal domain-like protein n=1 Tax=Rhodohalobacter sp. 614A TaxID=2908649 RepID=UPI001F251BB7|nr:enolase C-terminal domain-like protein [Rhodohalobacter sp. 614A]